jgi:hypothetical protein
MDVISAIRIIKSYNKEVEKFLLSNTWFQDVKKQKMELSVKYDKIHMMLKKVYPKCEAKKILANVNIKYFGVNDTDEIIKLLNLDNKCDFTEDKEVEIFLSNGYKQIVF